MHAPEICAGVIERLLKIKVDHIDYPELQKEIAPYYTTKGVRLVVYIKDSDRIFDIEMQTTRLPAIGKRMRFYQSMLDIDDLMKGAKYDELRESYVIFICKSSPFEYFDLPVYTFSENCRENPDVQLDDKSHKVIYNVSAYEQETDEALKSFLRFVSSGKTGDTFTERISSLIEKAKKAEANKTEYMSMNLHDYDIQRIARLEGKQEGREEGARENALANARNFLCEGLTSEQIARCCSLPLEEVLCLKAELEDCSQDNCD